MDFFDAVASAALYQLADPDRLAGLLVTSLLALMVYGIASLTPRAWGVAKLAARLSASAARRVAYGPPKLPEPPREPDVVDALAEHLADPDATMDTVEDGSRKYPVLLSGGVAVQFATREKFLMRVAIDGADGCLLESLSDDDRNRLLELATAAAKRVRDREAAKVCEAAKAALAKSAPTTMPKAK